MLVAVFILGGVGGLVSGCQTAPETTESYSAEGKSDMRILFDSIVDVFEAHSIEISAASHEMGVVTSEFKKIEPRLRRRYRARIVPVKEGVNALQLKLEYQREYGEESDSVWKEVQSEVLEKEAKEKELEIGREIQKTYEERRE